MNWNKIWKSRKNVSPAAPTYRQGIRDAITMIEDLREGWVSGLDPDAQNAWVYGKNKALYDCIHWLEDRAYEYDIFLQENHD